MSSPQHVKRDLMQEMQGPREPTTMMTVDAATVPERGVNLGVDDAANIDTATIVAVVDMNVMINIHSCTTTRAGFTPRSQRWAMARSSR